jgi:hypothetical protein
MKLIFFLLVLLFTTACNQSQTKDNAVSKKSQEGLVPVSSKNENCKCSNPTANLGDYTCINGIRYRCRNNVQNICEWQSTDEKCSNDEHNAKITPVTAAMLLPSSNKTISVSKNSTVESVSNEEFLPNTTNDLNSCAGQWVNYYCYKNKSLYVLNIGRASGCLDAYNIFKKCLGEIDNDTVYCNTVLACTPYTICN